MIVREWRALATKANAQAYIHFFGQTVVPILKTVEGNRGAWLMHRDVEAGVEIVALTLWESRDAIRAFGGADITRARVEPEAQALFIRFDDTVSLYEADLRIERPA
jgi:heme-degrading monooxygenase HmoA